MAEIQTQSTKASVKKYLNDHIASFTPLVKERLQKMHATIKKAAPRSTETIKYGIPTFELNGKNLVHFAGYKKHIGLYPAPSGIRAFKKELAKYKTSKGAVQFPHDETIPFGLITKIVKFRVKEIIHSYK